jgi:putative ABC transport system permease protein
VYTTSELSRRSRLHWLTKTGGGIGLGCAALLGLVVGAVVTSQTLYAAVAASLRAYAVLRALGIPRWRIAAMVLAQAFGVGLAGIVLALPATFAVARAVDLLGVTVLLPAWLLAGAAAVTLLMAVTSGLAALRCLRLVEPATLLR